MPITRLGLDGYGVRRAGSFAGKTATAEPVVAAPASVGGWKRRRGIVFGEEEREEVQIQEEAAPVALAIPSPAKKEAVSTVVERHRLNYDAIAAEIEKEAREAFTKEYAERLEARRKERRRRVLMLLLNS